MTLVSSATPEHVDNCIADLQAKVESLGPWFHSMRVGGVVTAPDHPLGNFPQVKWDNIQRAVPEDIRGMSVLDIGCNAGFYAQELFRRGAERVLAIDSNDHYLRQARFAAEINRCNIEFRKLSVYQLDQIKEKFDLVLFLGVFYHLRYPLYALDGVADKVNGTLLFQSLLRPRPGSDRAYPARESHPFSEEKVFAEDPDFPRMQFIENSYAGDPTNWWLPNAACIEALLRSVGMKIIDKPEDETWLCEPDPLARRGIALRNQELEGLSS